MNKRWQKVSREALEELAEAANAQLGGSYSVQCALSRVREEAGPPLRKRAEVDAEIVRVLRADVLKGSRDDCLAGGFIEKYDTANVLRKLCAEETQDP